MPVRMAAGACLLLVCCFGPRKVGRSASCTSDMKTSHRLSSWTKTLNSHDNNLHFLDYSSSWLQPLNFTVSPSHLPQTKGDLYVGRTVGKHSRWLLCVYEFFILIALIIWPELVVSSHCLPLRVETTSEHHLFKLGPVSMDWCKKKNDCIRVHHCPWPSVRSRSQRISQKTLLSRRLFH
jgi:hypothetical protein